VSPWLELIVYSSVPLTPSGEGWDGLQTRPLDPPPRPGDDVVFHNDESGVLERVRTAPHALGLRLRPAAGGLEEGLARAATFLEKLAARAVADQLAAAPTEPAAVDVVDVLCLDGRPIDQAIARLRSQGVQSRLWMRARPVADRFDVETFGLRRLGHREVLVPGVAAERLHLASRFVNQLAAYLLARGAVVSPGDAASFGWVDVRLRAAEGLAGFPDAPWQAAPAFLREAVGAFAPGSAEQLPGLLVVFEPQDEGPDPVHVPGANRALDLVQELVASAEQCGLSRGLDVPRAAHTAIVCTRFSEGPPVDVRRVPPDERCSSGWVGLCRHPDHDHGPASAFQEVPLRQLVAWVPRVFPLLAAPPGTGLSVGGDDELTIDPPDEGESEPAAG